MPIIEKAIEFHVESGSLMLAREYVLPFWMSCLYSVCSPESPPEWEWWFKDRNRSIISRYRLQRRIGRDMRLYQLMPNPWWQRLFIKVYSNRVSYRFFGMPLFSVIYENNRPVRRESAWGNLFKRCLGR